MVSKSCWRNISLPLQLSFSSVNKCSEGSIFFHECREGSSNLQFSCRNGTFSTGRKSYRSFLVSFNSLPSSCGLFTHVSSKDNQVEVFLDIVHDLGLQEGLGSIVHDFVAELGLCNVLSQLLDTSATSFRGSVQINNLVSIVLGSSSILKLGNKLFNNFKLSPEESIFLRVHDILVSFQERCIDSRDSLNKTLE